MGLWSLLQALLTVYGRIVAKRPYLVLFVYSAVVVALIGALWHPLQVEADFSSFIRADGPAMRQRDAFLLALQEKEGPSSRRLHATAVEDIVSADASSHQHSGRLLQGGSVVVQYEFTLIYEAIAGDMLDERALREVRDAELSLRDLPGWRELCGQRVTMVSRFRCDPGLSLAAYAWSSHLPTNKSGRLFSMRFDAQATEPFPVPALLAYLQQEEHVAHDMDRYFPGDFTPPGLLDNDTQLGREGSSSGPGLLRSQFTFLIDVSDGFGSTTALQAEVARAKASYRALLTDEVYPMLLQLNSQLEHVRLRYYGDILSGLEVDLTLRSDLLWAIGSAVFVAASLWLHTHSVVLSAASLVLVFLAVPVAYVLTPAARTTIASFLSLFLIAGIGSDVVFVFCDFWHQSRLECRERDLGERVSWTIARAGVNCLATSATTAASFLANLMSVLQPLREFGLFMGLCVLSSFVLMSLFLPPLLVLQARKRERRLAKKPVPALQDDHLSPVLPLPAPPPASMENNGTPVSMPKTRRSCVQVSLLVTLQCVEACPCTIVLCAVLCTVGFGVSTGLRAELDQGLPEVFPVGHNQFEVGLLQERFSAMPTIRLGSLPPAELGTVCNATTAGDCSLHWCDAAPGVEGLSCWHSPLPPTNSCSTLSLSLRAAGPTHTGWSAAFRDIMRRIGGQDMRLGRDSVAAGLAPLDLPPLVLEDWSTGRVGSSPFTDLGSLNATRTGVPHQFCSADVLCFLGPQHCALPGWRDAGPPAVSSANQRRLLVATVPRHKRIDVTVLWGVRARASTPLVGPSSVPWSFDPTFDLADPWAQRAIYAFCAERPSSLQVLAEGSNCWIDVFRGSLQVRGQRFPTRDFQQEAVAFFGETVLASEHLWFVDGVVRAAKLQFSVDVSKEAGSRAILSYKERWDAYVAERNQLAATTANQAWHTTGAWVTAEAEVAVVESTISTILISACCGAVGMLFFTGDPILAGMVFLLVLGVICGLACFMVAIMGWKLGPVEVISLVVFVGYSVTYSLHIAHLYSEAGADSLEAVQTLGPLAAPPGEVVLAKACDACGGAGCSFCRNRGCDRGPQETRPEPPPRELRRIRTRAAVLQVGGATLSSAMSTAGSSLFLLFCTMRIFTKLGAVVIAVTVLSCVFALVVLTAALLVGGPGLKPWYKACLRPRLRS